MSDSLGCNLITISTTAIAVLHDTMSYLLLDDACRWLKSLHLADLKVLHSDSDQLVRDIQDSVIAGTTVLVEVRTVLIFKLSLQYETVHYLILLIGP